jgi:transposase
MTDLMNSSLMNGNTDSSLAKGARPPDPEVAATAKRRKFSGSEKRRILHEADRCTKPGELGALLRREGIYSSMLATWRKQRARGEQAALAPSKRGRRPEVGLAQAREVQNLVRENARLRDKLERAHTIIDVQKKLCTLLGLPTAQEPPEKQ